MYCQLMLNDTNVLSDMNISNYVLMSIWSIVEWQMYTNVLSDMNNEFLTNVLMSIWNTVEWQMYTNVLSDMNITQFRYEYF
jgi:hypothetical protein